jgi:hypothetical protein
MGGGGGGHASYGGAHYGSPAGHGYYGGAHYGTVPHFTAAPHYYGGATHYGTTAHFTGSSYGAHANVVSPGHGGPVHGGPSSPAQVAPGHYATSAAWVPHYWGGGYWHGVWWPHVWYYPGYAWYWPVLPVGYATFWWGGVPYYYVNNIYYTYDPGYNGYVATDPPLSTDQSGAPADAYPDGSQPGDPQYGGSASPDVYVYPRNGQNEQQTANDRYECHGWAVYQTGFDPTRAGPQSGTSADYRQAMIACLDARGYTAR